MNRNLWRAVFAFVAFQLSSLDMLAAAEQPAASTQRITLVREGLSDYVIFYDARAPESVREAGRELRRVLQAATGAELPVVQQPGEFTIVLGDTAETRRAGIVAAELPDEGFGLRTQGHHLFIAGRDTRDGEFTAGGGGSDGTYYGVMEFLERAVGVRWLMPGPCGEDIPARITLELEPRKVGLLERPEPSTFYRSDADFQQFLEQNCGRPSISKTNAKPEIFLQPQLIPGPSKPASVDK